MNRVQCCPAKALFVKISVCIKTFSVGEVMTDTGSLDSMAVYRWRNSRQQNKMGILK